MRRLSPRIIALLCIALPGACSPATEAEDTAIDGKADGAKASSAAFFSQDAYFIRINGWPSGSMHPDAFRDGGNVKELSFDGAELLVYRGKADSPRHCPDAEVTAKDLVHRVRGKGFTLTLSGNKTLGTPKSSYKVSFEEEKGAACNADVPCPKTFECELSDKDNPSAGGRCLRDNRLAGMKKLNLKSMWNDVSQMREALAWRIFKHRQVTAPRHTYARFCINDRYYGLYSVIEQVDKAFIKDRFGDNTKGNLYKGDWPDGDLGPATLEYRGPAGKDYVTVARIERPEERLRNLDARTYKLKTNDEQDDDPAAQTYDDLARLIAVVDGRDLPGAGDARFETAEYQQAVEGILDVKAFLRWAAVNVLVGAWDNYWRTPSNYFLYNGGKPGAAKKFMKEPYFTFIPWDYDHSFGLDWIGVTWAEADLLSWGAPLRGSSGRFSAPRIPLLQNLLKNSAFKKYYLQQVESLLDEQFSTTWIDQQIGKRGSGGLYDRIRVSAMLESPVRDKSNCLSSQRKDLADIYCVTNDLEVQGNAATFTGRKFSWDQVYYNGVAHHELSHQGAYILGIWHHVNWRASHARKQLQSLR